MPELKPEQVTAIIDSREQAPFNLEPMKMEKGSLRTGDYTVKGLEDAICVERKSIPDLVACMGKDRERFEAELHRIMAFPVRAVVVEGSYSDLVEGNYQSNLNPKAAINTVASWLGRFGTPFAFCDTRIFAQQFTARFMFHECRRWHEKATKLEF